MKYAIALLVVVPTMVAAQAPAAIEAPVPVPDPARIAAARIVIDDIFPPATREQMIVGMLTPMLGNLRRGMMQDPNFAQALGGDARVKALFDSFMQKQQERTTAQMRTALPGMAEAMTNAYARRFDLAQLHDLKTFFETPTGRAYMQASIGIMSDPDVAAWQRGLMTQSMSHIQADVKEFATQVAALKAKPKTP